MIETIASIVLLTLAGLPFALLVHPRVRHPLTIGLSFLFGAGIGTTVLLIFSLLRVRWDLGLFVFVLLALALVGRAFHPSGPATRPGESTGRSLVVADVLAVILIVAHAFYVTGVPLWEWDFLAHWGSKAKVFSAFQGIDWAFMSFADYFFISPDYPPLVSLLMDIPPLFAGSWNDRYLGLLFTALGVAAILVVRGFALLETGSRAIASLASLAVASPLLTLWIGLGEAAIAAYGTAAVLLLRAGRTYAGAVMLGFAMLSKNEGSALWIAVVIATLLTGTNRARRLLQLWPSLALFLPWMGVRLYFKFAPLYFQGSIAQRLQHQLTETGDILYSLIRWAPDKRLMWVALIIIVAWRSRWIWRNERFLAVVITCQISIFVAQNFLTPFPAGEHIKYSWHRLMYQIAALIIVLALLALRPLFNRTDNDLATITPTDEVARA